MSHKNIFIEVMRYRPEHDIEPWYQGFNIPWTDDMSILDALNYIKDHLEPELSYRWSCRMAVCGSCGMVINGEPKLSCSTFIRDYANHTDTIRIGALDHFAIEKDLVVDIDPFIRKLEAVKPYVIEAQSQAATTTVSSAQTPVQELVQHYVPNPIGAETVTEKTTIASNMPDDFSTNTDITLANENITQDQHAFFPVQLSLCDDKSTHTQTPAQLASFKNYTLCINCLLCYQACPQVALNDNFLGPAAIALATRYSLDSRDHGSQERASALYSEDGTWPCTFVGYCSIVCPKLVDPAAAIQQTKSKGLIYWLTSRFLPTGAKE